MVQAVRAVADHVARALEEDADVLVIGGNCTVALGVMAALTERDPDAGLLYIDRHFDLNTPASTHEGALDWMGLAHGLDLPGAAEPLAAAFAQRPLLTPDGLHLLGIDPAAATVWEREQATGLGLRWGSHTDLATAPGTEVTRALGTLLRAPGRAPRRRRPGLHRRAARREHGRPQQRPHARRRVRGAGHRLPGSALPGTLGLRAQPFPRRRPPRRPPPLRRKPSTRPARHPVNGGRDI
ncbi:arginase family protein [Kitasatospora aburaviensis]